MAIQLAPSSRQRFVDQNGAPLAGGKVYTYIAGTLSLVVTYSDKLGTENANPIILDSAGKCDIWLNDTISYKFVVTDANDVQIDSVDSISVPAAGSGSGGSGGGALRAGQANISTGFSTVTITFSTPVTDTSYRVTQSILNTTDADPIFLSGVVTSKTVNGFTLKLNAPTDSFNYRVEYSIHATV